MNSPASPLGPPRTPARAVARWILIGYLAFALLFGWLVVGPALQGHGNLRYWADTDKYMVYWSRFSLSEVLNGCYNAVGPAILVNLTHGNNLLLAALNVALLGFVISLAWRRLPIHPLSFLLLVLLNPMLFFSLTAVNKEILAFASLLFAAVFLERSRWYYSVIALALAVLARWPQALILGLFFALRWINTKLSRSSSFTYVWLALIMAAGSIIYPIIRRQASFPACYIPEVVAPPSVVLPPIAPPPVWSAPPFSPLIAPPAPMPAPPSANEFQRAVGNQMSRGNHILERLNAIQDKHWYGFLLVLLPKAALQWTGNILRLGPTLSRSDPNLNYDDLYNTYVILGHQLWMTVAVIALLVMRRTYPASYTTQLILIYLASIAATPYINYRLLFPVVGLIACQLSRRRNPSNLDTPAVEPSVRISATTTR